MSNGIMYLNSFGITFIHFFETKQSEKHKPVIDMNLALILLAPMTLGEFTGSIVAVLVHSAFQLALLAFMFSLTLFKSYTAATELWAKETKEIERNQRILEGKENPTNQKEKTENKNLLEPEKFEFGASPETNQRLKALRARESKIFDFKKAILTIVVVALSIIIILLNGGKGLKSVIGIGMSDREDWGSTIGYILVCIFVSLLSYIVVKREGDEKKEITGENSYDAEHPILFTCFGFIIGFFASILGIGGATLLTPIFIAFGYEPVVIKATNVYLICLTKTASVLIFLVFGVLHIDYFLFVGLISMVCVTIAHWRLSMYVKKMGR